MKIKEIRSLSESSLKERLGQIKTELIKDNAQVAIGTNPKSPLKIRNAKKTIAKILTILNEKKMEESKKK